MVQCTILERLQINQKNLSKLLEFRKRIYDSFQIDGLDLTVSQVQIGLDEERDGEINQEYNNLKDLR